MSNALQTISSTLSSRFNMGDNGQEVINVLINTAFKINMSEPQLMALMIVCDQYGLNPFTKEIYAYPDKNNGIVPVVGLDGWSRIINEHPMFDGIDFIQNNDYCTCTMHRKDRAHPISVTEWHDECYRPPIKKDGYEIKGAWQTHPKRMLRHKALIQCARLAFGFVGIYDQDEAERIVEEIPKMEVRPGKRVATPVLDDRLETITQEIQRLLDDDDISVINEWSALNEEEHDLVNKCLTTSQKKSLKNLSYQVYLIGVSDYIKSLDNIELMENYVESLPKLVKEKMHLIIDEKIAQFQKETQKFVIENEA